MPTKQHSNDYKQGYSDQQKGILNPPDPETMYDGGDTNYYDYLYGWGSSADESDQ